MNKIQLDNLINFTFLFLSNNKLKMPIGNSTTKFPIDIKLNNKLPSTLNSDYIIEKWDKFIGYDTKNYKDFSFIEFKKKFNDDLDNDDLNIHLWFEKWNKDGDNWYKIYPILKYLNSFKSIKNITIKEILDIFEKVIGNVENISSIEYNNIHPVLRNKISDWKKTKQVKREYFLKMILKK